MSVSVCMFALSTLRVIKFFLLKNFTTTTTPTTTTTTTTTTTVMDLESGDGERDEGDEDWLAIVIRLTELYFQSLTTLSLSEWSFCTAICISGVGFLVSLDHLQQS